MIRERTGATALPALGDEVPALGDEAGSTSATGVISSTRVERHAAAERRVSKLH